MGHDSGSERGSTSTPFPAMNCKIVITEPHSGELGEAIKHEDHGFAMEEYSFEQGRQLEVFVHDTSDPHWHIFTDLDSGHRFKIPADKYRRLD
jgi:hypothetical protein